MKISTLGLTLDDKDTLFFNGRELVPNYQEGCQVMHKWHHVTESASINLEGYFIGTYLGDGNLDWRLNKERTERLYVAIRANIHSDALWAIQSYLDNYYLSFEYKNFRGKLGDYCNGITRGKGVRAFAKSIYDKAGMTNSKHVPYTAYSQSISFRASIIAGMMDTDGAVERTEVAYDTISYQLATDFCKLCYSLGIVVKLTIATARYRDRVFDYYRVRIKAGESLNEFRRLVPMQVKYKVKALDKFSYGGRESFGYRFDREYINELNIQLSGKYHDYLKCRLREYIKGNRKTISRVLLRDMIVEFEDETILQEVLEYIPCEVFY